MPNGITGVILAFVLIFFAFIGFEDMANVAEEVKRPKKTLPRAIILSIVITAVIYILVAVSAVRVLDWQILGQSGAPLADIATKGIRIRRRNYSISYCTFCYSKYCSYHISGRCKNTVWNGKRWFTTIFSGKDSFKDWNPMDCSNWNFWDISCICLCRRYCNCSKHCSLCSDHYICHG